MLEFFKDIKEISDIITRMSVCSLLSLICVFESAIIAYLYRNNVKLNEDVRNDFKMILQKFAAHNDMED